MINHTKFIFVLLFMSSSLQIAASLELEKTEYDVPHDIVYFNIIPNYASSFQNLFDDFNVTKNEIDFLSTLVREAYRSKEYDAHQVYVDNKVKQEIKYENIIDAVDCLVKHVNALRLVSKRADSFLAKNEKLIAAYAQGRYLLEFKQTFPNTEGNPYIYYQNGYWSKNPFFHTVGIALEGVHCLSYDKFLDTGLTQKLCRCFHSSTDRTYRNCLILDRFEEILPKQNDGFCHKVFHKLFKKFFLKSMALKLEDILEADIIFFNPFWGMVKHQVEMVDVSEFATFKIIQFDDVIDYNTFIMEFKKNPTWSQEEIDLLTNNVISIVKSKSLETKKKQYLFIRTCEASHTLKEKIDIYSIFQQATSNSIQL